ncbi:MAG: hypothetical protein Q8K79_16170 [Solirubrobacteraceae bacterium]|nr:hypothetical protein [Solirubrobacteraceae bacterium]
MSRIRKTTALVAAAALLGGGGLGAAQAATGDGARPDRSVRSAQGGPMNSASLAKIASTLGVTAAQLRAALEANRPAKPARAARGADGMASELAAALGVDVADVQEILAANRPAKPARGTQGARRAARGAKPSNTKLIAALASGLNLDAATVRAAFTKIEADHRAAHAAREAATYAAVAQQLGLETAAVKAAFAASRPAKPAR